MDLNGIAMFTRVVQRGSFSQAARDLGVTKSTISKKISELESTLGTRLLRRTTRSLQLTDTGKRFHDQCLAALTGIKHAAEVVQAENSEPRGLLRVTCPTDFASAVLPTILASFLDAHPKVTIDLVLSDRRLDLVAENIDVAIRLGKLEDSTFRAKKIGYDVFQLVASPDYLKRRGTPSSITDLSDHHCIAFLPRPGLTTWPLKTSGGRKNVTPAARLSATNITVVKALVMQGAGISLLPISACRDEIAARRLRIVLPAWSMDEAVVHLVYQRELYATPKVKVFVTHLEKQLTPLFVG